MKPPSFAETQALRNVQGLAELNQADAHKRLPVAAHDAGKIVDYKPWCVSLEKSYRVRVVLGSMMGLHSVQVFKTLETIEKMGVPVDLTALADAVMVLEHYANTLKGYVQVDKTGAVCLNSPM